MEFQTFDVSICNGNKKINTLLEVQIFTRIFALKLFMFP